MLDLEVVEEATEDGLALASLEVVKKHMRISSSNTALDDQITDAIKEAAASLHGRDGLLNRTIFPTVWCRYFRRFPASRVIQLPFPPLIEVLSVGYANGESPEGEIDPADYTVRLHGADGQVGEIELNAGLSWPVVSDQPRGAWVVFRAGYEEYPPSLIRLVKILAAHNVENLEATINEPRQMAINRRVDFGVDYLVNLLRVPVSQDDWC